MDFVITLLKGVITKCKFELSSARATRMKPPVPNRSGTFDTLAKPFVDNTGLASIADICCFHPNGNCADGVDGSCPNRRRDAP